MNTFFLYKYVPNIFWGHMYTKNVLSLFIWNSKTTGHSVSHLLGLVSESSGWGVLGVGYHGKRGDRGRHQMLKTSCIDLVRPPEDKFVPKGLGECDWRCWRCNCEGWGWSQWCMKMVWQDAQFCQHVLFQFLLYRYPWYLWMEWCSDGYFSISSMYFGQWRGLEVWSLSSDMDQCLANINVYTSHLRI